MIWSSVPRSRRTSMETARLICLTSNSKVASCRRSVMPRCERRYSIPSRRGKMQRTGLIQLLRLWFKRTLVSKRNSLRPRQIIQIWYLSTVILKQSCANTNSRNCVNPIQWSCQLRSMSLITLLWKYQISARFHYAAHLLMRLRSALCAPSSKMFQWTLRLLRWPLGRLRRLWTRWRVSRWWNTAFSRLPTLKQGMRLRPKCLKSIMLSRP